MWIALRILGLTRVKTFTYISLALYLTINSTATTADPNSTCWVYGGLRFGQNAQMVYGLNALYSEIWPDTSTAFQALEDFTASRLIGAQCGFVYPPSTISRIDKGHVRISMVTSGRVGDPQTGVTIGYSQTFAGFNQSGEYCSVYVELEILDGTHFGRPQCQQNYSIKLSPLSGSAESGTILTSIGPDKSTGSLVAKVYDQNNQLVLNVGVQLTLEAKQNSGGHHHGDNSVAARTGTMQGQQVLTGNTGPNGLQFSYKAPSVSGDYKIVASCADGKNCTQEGPDTVWVGVKGLEPIIPASDSASGPLYVLIGQDSYHPDNHYLTPLAMGRLQQLASHYRERFPNDPPLYLNDASLERGGLFDSYYDYVDKYGVRHERNAEGWWSTPHKEHRRGTVIDVRANQAAGAIPSRNHRVFMQFTRDIGAAAGLHSPGTDNQHFHIRLMGVAE